MRNSKIITHQWKTVLKLFLLLFMIAKAQISMDLDIDEGDTMTSTTNVVYKFSLITNRYDNVLLIRCSNSISAGTKVQVKIPYQLNTDGS
jgi:hypothetical protein